MKYHKVKATIRHMGGGGSSTPPVVQNIPDWMRPAIDRVQNETGALYDSGQLSQVAGYNDNLISAGIEGAEGIKSSTRANEGHLSAQMGRLTTHALDGNKGATDAQMGLALAQETASNNASFGANGTLGSARNVMANANAASESGVKAAQQIWNNQKDVEKGIIENSQAQLGLLSGATNTVANLGQQQRAIEQQQLDAPWQGLQRAASTIYGNPARQSAAPSGGK